jgi:SAM-dependent methyltransferase
MDLQDKRNACHLFTHRAKFYTEYRPLYPQEAIDIILNDLYVYPPRVADIGAGTCISSYQLVERQVSVVAIEPDVAMRQEAHSHPLLDIREGTAEATGLISGSCDLVTCFQSFHWFEAKNSLREFYRILTPYGRLALVWVVPDTTDEFTLSYARIVTETSTIDRRVYSLSRHSQCLDSTLAACNKYMHIIPFIEHLPENAIIKHHRFTIRHELKQSGLVKSAMTLSFTPLAGPVANKIEEGLQQLYEESHHQDNPVSLKYICIVYIIDQAASIRKYA